MGQIRLADINDSNRLMDIYIESIDSIPKIPILNPEQRQYWKSQLDELHEWDSLILNHVVAVWEEDSIVYGFIDIRDGNIIHLIYVDSTKQKSGIGRELLKWAEDYIKSIGHNEVKVQTNLFAERLFATSDYEFERDVIKRVHATLSFHYKIYKKNLNKIESVPA